MCHGAEALVGPVDPQGKPIIAGKVSAYSKPPFGYNSAFSGVSQPPLKPDTSVQKVTGFSTAEEEVGYEAMLMHNSLQSTPAAFKPHRWQCVGHRQDFRPSIRCRPRSGNGEAGRHLLQGRL